jgi:hypothetical protein
MENKNNDPLLELTPEENLRADNELAALNLEMNYGATVHIGDEAPPEVIQQFLANVAAFESMHQGEGGETTVYKRLGEPPFAVPGLLEKTTLPGEIERLSGLLEQNGLVVLRPDDLDDLDFYTFIIEDIFPHSVPATHIPGMVTCLDYADFYPDEKWIIGQVAEAFLLDLLHLKKPFTGTLLSETCRDDHNVITRAQALQIIADFRSRYETVVPVGFGLEQLIEPGNGIYQTFGIRWEGIPVNGAAKEEHEGLGVIQVAFENGRWMVQGVSMPGFKF